jgi:Protein of unknown function (DUF2589)
MADIPASLKQLPLEHIIGAPLEAAIKAQAMSSRTSIEFIQQVGLTRDAAGNLKAVSVDFQFDRTLEEIVQPPGTPAPAPITNFRIVPSKLTVPLLAIVDVPAFRINDMTIDFEYHIRDVETSTTSTEFGVEATVEAQFWFVKVEVKGSYSNKTANTRETDQSTTLRITVHAGQQSIPEGLSRVLDMMHDQLQVVPLSSGTLLPTPSARIESVNPLIVSKGASQPVTLDVQGSGLTGGSKAEVDDTTVTGVTLEGAPLAPVAPATDVAKATVKMSLVQATKPGEKTLTILTPQGRAQTRFAVTA